MSNEQNIPPIELSTKEIPSLQLSAASDASCVLDAEGHCITCSDEALPARVQRVDPQAGVAFVTINDTIEEVDITLVDDVVPGDLLLVHGGVAIANIDKDSFNDEANDA
jgi:hydrogenase maturation factor